MVEAMREALLLIGIVTGYALIIYGVRGLLYTLEAWRNGR